MDFNTIPILIRQTLIIGLKQGQITWRMRTPVNVCVLMPNRIALPVLGLHFTANRVQSVTYFILQRTTLKNEVYL